MSVLTNVAQIGRRISTRFGLQTRRLHRNNANQAKMLSDPENRGSRQQHINFDILGIWDNRIDFTILFQQSIKHGMPIPRISAETAGIASQLGRRSTNEDRFR